MSDINALAQALAAEFVAHGTGDAYYQPFDVVALPALRAGTEVVVMVQIRHKTEREQVVTNGAKLLEAVKQK